MTTLKEKIKEALHCRGHHKDCKCGGCSDEIPALMQLFQEFEAVCEGAVPLEYPIQVLKDLLHVRECEAFQKGREVARNSLLAAIRGFVEGEKP